MKNLLEIFKCSVCGNMVEGVHVGGGELVCCEKPMNKIEPGTVDAAVEKHVPEIKKVDNGYEVIVGSVAHPMEEKHYIEWVELIADGKSYMHFLKPGDEPKAKFCVKADKVKVREYCNLHGVWKKDA